MTTMRLFYFLISIFHSLNTFGQVKDTAVESRAKILAFMHIPCGNRKVFAAPSIGNKLNYIFEFTFLDFPSMDTKTQIAWKGFTSVAWDYVLGTEANRYDSVIIKVVDSTRRVLAYYASTRKENKFDIMDKLTLLSSFCPILTLFSLIPGESPNTKIIDVRLVYPKNTCLTSKNMKGAYAFSTSLAVIIKGYVTADVEKFPICSVRLFDEHNSLMDAIIFNMKKLSKW